MRENVAWYLMYFLAALAFFMRIEFLSLTKDHFSLLWTWHSAAHVQENWNSYSDFEELCASYEKKLKSEMVYSFVVAVDGTPFAYLQAYQAWRVGEGWWPDETEGCWGLDQFIGEVSFLGQGLGSLFMDQFVREWLVPIGAKKVIVDPSPGNMRAIRAYEKAGFQSKGLVDTPDGPALYMERLLT